MHSRISIANEYVSECVVGEALLSSMSSGAAYLTICPDVTVFVTKFSLIASEILAISKSQICGSPLPVRGQPLSRESDVNMELTS